jgi:hypothetical protein
LVKAAVVSAPEFAPIPLHPPEAEQEVALVVAHVSTEVAP